MNSRNHKQDILDALDLMSKSHDIIKDTHGNVSCRDDSGNIYIKPSGMPYGDLVLPDDVSVADIEGNQVSGLYKHSVDLIHHAAIYESKHWVKAICHTHSPYATAYAYNSKAIKCYGTEQADIFGDDIYCLTYQDLETWGPSVGKFLHRTAKAILLSRHGVLTFAETALDAVKLAVAVENIATKNFLSEALFNNDSRRELSQLHSLEIKKWHTRYNTKYGQSNE